MFYVSYMIKCMRGRLRNIWWRYLEMDNKRMEEVERLYRIEVFGEILLVVFVLEKVVNISK